MYKHLHIQIQLQTVKSHSDCTHRFSGLCKAKPILHTHSNPNKIQKQTDNRNNNKFENNFKINYSTATNITMFKWKQTQHKLHKNENNFKMKLKTI